MQTVIDKNDRTRFVPDNFEDIALDMASDDTIPIFQYEDGAEIWFNNIEGWWAVHFGADTWGFKAGFESHTEAMSWYHENKG